MIDATQVTYSNIADDTRGSMLSIHDVKLHVLGHDNRFDLVRRQPIVPGDSK